MIRIENDTTVVEWFKLPDNFYYRVFVKTDSGLLFHKDGYELNQVSLKEVA